jgi:hypothetical protein
MATDTNTEDGISVSVRFTASPGSRYNARDAARIGPELLRLKNLHGTLTKAVVVESAESAQSPLHTEFEWDDAKAAKLHRLEHARYIMRSIMVVWDESSASGETEQVSTRLFHSVRVPKEEGDAAGSKSSTKQVYVSLQDVIENEDYAAQVIESMEQALERVNSRFSLYLDKLPMFAERFQAVFDEIRALED